MQLAENEQIIQDISRILLIGYIRDIPYPFLWDTKEYIVNTDGDFCGSSKQTFAVF